jgi:thiol-disulfide isomerase/thioredoxin
MNSSSKLLLSACLSLALMGGADAAPRIGQTAPPAVARTLDGQTFDLSALRGRVVVINVWATWCGPCRSEMPALDAVYGRRHGQGLEMIGLSADKARDRDKVRQVMAAFHYPAALAEDTRAGALTDTGSLPVTYVIDKAGVVRAVINGGSPLTVTVLEVILAPLLAEAPPGPSSDT